MNVSLPTLNSFKATSLPSSVPVAPKSSSFAGALDHSMSASAQKVSASSAATARKSNVRNAQSPQAEAKNDTSSIPAEIKAQPLQLQAAPTIPIPNAPAQGKQGPDAAQKTFPEIPGVGTSLAESTSTNAAAPAGAYAEPVISPQTLTASTPTPAATEPQQVVSKMSSEGNEAKATHADASSTPNDDNTAGAGSTNTLDASDALAALQSLISQNPVPLAPASPIQVTPSDIAKGAANTLTGVAPTGNFAAGKATASSSLLKTASASEEKRKADIAHTLPTTDVSSTPVPQDKVQTIIGPAIPQHVSNGAASDNSTPAAIQQAVSGAVSADQQAKPADQPSVDSQANLPLPTPPAHVEVASPSSVQSAQLIQSINHSEMKLGLQSQEFGDISISTTLNRQSISAQISIDHAELGKALALHLPAIEEKLSSAYGVQAKVAVQDAAQSFAGGQSNQGESYNRSRTSQTATYLGGSPSASQKEFVSSSAMPQPAESARLDIRI